MKNASEKMELIDFDKQLQTKVNKRKKGHLAFSRYLITGASGSGKTTLLLSILFNSKVRPDFEKVVLVSPSIGEEKYHLLERRMREFEKDNELKKGEAFEWYREGVPELSELSLPAAGDTVVIFDDLLRASKADMDRIVDYFVRGRHRRCMLFFLSQSFYETDKTIRNNCGVYIFTSLSGHDCSMVKRDLTPDLSTPGFQRLMKKGFAVQKNGMRGFILIDTLAPSFKQRYRTCLNPDIGESEESESSEE